ncbi:M28 family peptidase [Spirosoma litoris]
MHLLKIIQDLEGSSNNERSNYIKRFLSQNGIDYSVQQYQSGANLIVRPNHRKAVVALSSHFDVVPESPGANDNASAIAVCFAILYKIKTHRFTNFDLAVFFFDEEERGLKGSKAYVNQFGIDDIEALINLELVGQGDRFALWSLNETSSGKILEAFEEAARGANIYSRRFDQIVTNSADHLSFRKAGLNDAFTITCVSEEDLNVAYHYYKAQEFDVDRSVLQEIMQQAPIFKHYHKPTDLSIHLSEVCLQQTTETIWSTLLKFDDR